LFQIFHWYYASYRNKITAYEKLRENLVVDSGCCNVHDSICGGQAELQSHGQELSNE